MDIVIRAWALNSYLELKYKRGFTGVEYQKTIRPDVMLLTNFPEDPMFTNSKFWSPATDASKNVIPNGFKMKWHNMGNGRNQIRLSIGMFSEALLCEGYMKKNAKQELRMIAKFKTYLQLIRRGQYTECGRLQ